MALDVVKRSELVLELAWATDSCKHEPRVLERQKYLSDMERIRDVLLGQEGKWKQLDDGTWTKTGKFYWSAGGGIEKPYSKKMAHAWEYDCPPIKKGLVKVFDRFYEKFRKEPLIPPGERSNGSHIRIVKETAKAVMAEIVGPSWSDGNEERLEKYIWLPKSKIQIDGNEVIATTRSLAVEKELGIAPNPALPPSNEGLELRAKYLDVPMPRGYQRLTAPAKIVKETAKAVAIEDGIWFTKAGVVVKDGYLIGADEWLMKEKGVKGDVDRTVDVPYVDKSDRLTEAKFATLAAAGAPVTLFNKEYLALPAAAVQEAAGYWAENGHFYAKEGAEKPWELNKIFYEELTKAFAKSPLFLDPATGIFMEEGRTRMKKTTFSSYAFSMRVKATTEAAPRLIALNDEKYNAYVETLNEKQRAVLAGGKDWEGKRLYYNRGLFGVVLGKRDKLYFDKETLRFESGTLEDEEIDKINDEFEKLGA